MKAFESRLTSMFQNLVEKNGLEIMNYAVETLKNLTVGTDSEKTMTTDKSEAGVVEGATCVSKKPTRPAAKVDQMGAKKMMNNIKITITSHKLEFSVPPEAIVSAMEEILDCVACAIRHVWGKVKDFFAWIWQKLSQLLCTKSRA